MSMLMRYSSSRNLLTQSQPQGNQSAQVFSTNNSLLITNDSST